MKRVNELKAGALLSYISIFLGNIVSILYTPIMLRLLGQSEYGLYSLANSVVGYLSVLNFGFGSAVVKYTAKYKAEDDKLGEYNLNGMFIIVYSILAVIVIAAGTVLLFNVEKLFSMSLTTSEINKVKFIMVLLIFNMAISLPFGVFGSIITAYEKFIFPKVIGLIRTIINPFIMLPLLFMGYKSVAMTFASTLINLLFISVNMFYCFKILKIKIKFDNLDFSIFKEIFRYSFFIFLNMIVDKIYWSTDQLILGTVKGTISVAIYSIGSTFNNYYMSFSTAISGVFLPKVTRMVTKNSSDEELSDLFIKTGRIQYIILSFVLCGFLIVGQDFINLWAGPEYSEAYYIALIVMIPLTIPLIQNMGITILQAKNMHKFRSILYIIIAFINLFASIPMAMILGGVGAALCTALSMVIGNILIINIYYYKKLNINIPKFWSEILKMSFPVLMSLGIGFILNSIIKVNGVVGIIINGVIFVFVFITLMWNYGMNSYERHLFSEPIIKIGNKILKRGVAV